MPLETYEIRENNKLTNNVIHQISLFHEREKQKMKFFL